MTQSIPIPARDPRFYAETGDGPARWYAAVDFADHVASGDEILERHGWNRIDDRWKDHPYSQIFGGMLKGRWLRRPLADPPWGEMAECLWDGAIYVHPVTGACTANRETAIAWLKALGNSQAALDGSGDPASPAGAERVDGYYWVRVSVGDGTRWVIDIWLSALKRWANTHQEIEIGPAIPTPDQLAVERAEGERLRAELARHTVSAGAAQHYELMAKATCDSLGLPLSETSPNKIREVIEKLNHELELGVAYCKEAKSQIQGMDDIAALKSRAEAAEAMVAWRPIETAPRSGRWILLWWPEVTDAAFAGYWCEVVNRWVDAVSGSGWHSLAGPSHWQPLPSPPSGEVAKCLGT